MDDSNHILCELIAQKIAETPEQGITFAEFMDLVLYHPEQGYYSTHPSKIGAQGDFFTSPHLGADFGELLAEQFVQMWTILGKPNPFTLVEMGAGQGILASDILRYLQKQNSDFYNCLEYRIIEKSVALRTQQQQILQASEVDSKFVQWCELEDLPNGAITGCFFSNELVDAFPVHQVIVKDRQLQEIYVIAASDTSEPSCGFTEAIAKLSTPQLRDYFQFIGIDILSKAYPEGYRTEVNLAALDWIKTVAVKLHQGFVLTIDYGYPAQRYYLPSRRSGTLQCYYQHRHHNDPYLYMGRQDLTAHVDFTALEKQGELWGLETVGFTQQALFLMALGLGDRIAALSYTSELSLSEVLRRREALHSLIDPMGLGGFGVLVQSKGLTQQQKSQFPLKGLSLPTDGNLV